MPDLPSADAPIQTTAPASNSPAPAANPAPTPAPAAPVVTDPAKAVQPVVAPATKPADTAITEPVTAATTPKPVEGAPEKYEFKPTDKVSFDDTVIGAFSKVAKDLNLTQANAQKILDEVSPVIVAQQQALTAKAKTEWISAVHADKEFGGDNLTSNLAIAKRALDTFGTPELNKLLDVTGLGNNPEIIRAFYRAGKAIAEDKVVTSGNARVQLGDNSAAQALYGK